MRQRSRTGGQRASATKQTTRLSAQHQSGAQTMKEIRSLRLAYKNAFGRPIRGTQANDAAWMRQRIKESKQESSAAGPLANAPIRVVEHVLGSTLKNCESREIGQKIKSYSLKHGLEARRLIDLRRSLNVFMDSGQRCQLTIQRNWLRKSKKLVRKRTRAVFARVSQSLEMKLLSLMRRHPHRLHHWNLRSQVVMNQRQMKGKNAVPGAMLSSASSILLSARLFMMGTRHGAIYASQFSISQAHAP